jgi:hypothetical protein
LSPTTTVEGRGKTVDGAEKDRASLNFNASASAFFFANMFFIGLPAVRPGHIKRGEPGAYGGFFFSLRMSDTPARSTREGHEECCRIAA